MSSKLKIQTLACKYRTKKAQDEGKKEIIAKESNNIEISGKIYDNKKTTHKSNEMKLDIYII